MLRLLYSKSQIAIEFSHRYHEKWPYRWVFWVYEGTRTRFTQSYEDIVTKVDIPGRQDQNVDRLVLVGNWLSEVNNGPWLIVIDNAEDRDVLLKSPENVDTDSK